MKKRVLTLVCCLLIAIMTIYVTGCSGEDKYIGKWTSTTCEYQGSEASTEQTVGLFSLAINEDGTTTFVCYGLDASGTWIENEDGTITVTSDTFEDISLEEKDGQLILDLGELVVYYDKQEE